MAHHVSDDGRRSNWGRWGDTDQRGTLNLLSPDLLVQAAGIVREGKMFELSIPIEETGPQVGGMRFNAVHRMSLMPGEFFPPDLLQTADDIITMPLQGATQWDSLAHVGYGGYFYNGVPVSEVTAREGAARNSIVAALPGVVGRAVLIDVARHRGVEWLRVEDEPIRPAELDEVLAAQGIELRTADIVLIRTGWRRKAVVEGWSQEWIETNPGLHPECAEWLDDNAVMAVCSDNHSIDAVPMIDPETCYPLHGAVIRDLGMMMGEIWDLEELAADSAADGRWESFLVAPPLRVVGGVGSPVSPIAIK